MIPDFVFVGTPLLVFAMMGAAVYFKRGMIALIGGVALVGVVCVALGWGANRSQAETNEQLLAHGQEVPAIIVDILIDSSPKWSWEEMVVEFEVEDRRYRRTINGLAGGPDLREYQEGQFVALLVDPSDPSHVRLRDYANTNTDGRVLVACGVMILGLAALLGCAAVDDRRKQQSIVYEVKVPMAGS